MLKNSLINFKKSFICVIIFVIFYLTVIFIKLRHNKDSYLDYNRPFIKVSTP